MSRNDLAQRNVVYTKLMNGIRRIVKKLVSKEITKNRVTVQRNTTTLLQNMLIFYHDKTLQKLIYKNFEIILNTYESVPILIKSLKTAYSNSIKYGLDTKVLLYILLTTATRFNYICYIIQKSKSAGTGKTTKSQSSSKNVSKTRTKWSDTCNRTRIN